MTIVDATTVDAATPESATAGSATPGSATPEFGTVEHRIVEEGTIGSASAGSATHSGFGRETVADGRLEWTSACPLSRLIPGLGVAVLLRGGEQVALFLLDDGSLRAVGNIDPFGRAAVMSRGLVGDRGGEPTVASPLLKQVFSLVDGRCLDDESVRLPVYDVRVWAGVVQVHSPLQAGAGSA